MAASFLEKLKNGKVPLEVVVRGKDADENAKQIEQCLDIVKKAGVCAIILLTLGEDELG